MQAGVCLQLHKAVSPYVQIIHIGWIGQGLSEVNMSSKKALGPRPRGSLSELRRGNDPLVGLPTSTTAGRLPVRSVEYRLQTIERTSKKWKAIQLLGLITLCFGLGVGLRVDTAAGLLVIGAGVAVLAVGRFFAWWNHG